MAPNMLQFGALIVPHFMQADDVLLQGDSPRVCARQSMNVYVTASLTAGCYKMVTSSTLMSLYTLM